MRGSMPVGSPASYGSTRPVGRAMIARASSRRSPLCHPALAYHRTLCHRYRANTSSTPGKDIARSCSAFVRVRRKSMGIVSAISQGDRTNLIILLPRSKIGSPVTNEAGLEPDTWARAPRWRAWQAAPPRWHGHPDGLRSAHLGSSPLVRGSWWRPQRRRCATGSVVLLGWCDHPAR